MKHLLSLLFLTLFLSTSEAQKKHSLLETAYKNRSIPELETFFEKWVLETPPISDSDFSALNDTLQNVYLVFQNFYNPTDVNRTGGSEWGNDIYKNVKYLLVQSRIEYGMVDTLDRDLVIQQEINRYTKGDSTKLANLLHRYNGDLRKFKDDFYNWPQAKNYKLLDHFRPKFAYVSPKVIFLDSSYRIQLNQFLGNEHYKLGRGNIMSPAISKGESAKRKEFLENEIRIWYGHWGGYWQLNSYPYAERITFDKDFKNALVDYRMVYEGGIAYFKKINGAWVLIEAKLTWIE